MTRPLTLVLALVAVVATTPAAAQSKPAKPSPAKPAQTTATRDDGIRVRGFVTFGSFTARATETFDAVLGTNAGPIVGGGGQVLLPRGFYVEASVSRFRREGERVFVTPAPDLRVFPLDIPLEVTLTPIELTGGWRYQHCPRAARTRTRICRPAVVPYIGGGVSSYGYRETSPFGDGVDVDERFTGFHVIGGAEYRARPWLAVGGELGWSSIPDAIGEGGVAAVFDEHDLGGTTLRLKISVGR